MGVLLAIFNIISGTYINGKNLRVGVSAQRTRASSLMGEVLSILKNSLNFSTTFVSQQNSAGSGDYDKETGEWNGLIGMIHRNEIDFGLGKFWQHEL